MKKLLKIITAAAGITLTAYVTPCEAQQVTPYNPNKIYYPEYQQSARAEFSFPKVGKYEVMICDFHSHTMFSDGLVWPTYRVEEAWNDGLDALAITDHIEYLPFKKYLNSDHNTSYEIAKPKADELGFILIKGSEITRKQAVLGHFNALFIKDANPIAVEDPKASILEARKQGAFIIWNHPGWAVDSTYMKDFQKNLLDEKLFDGIEVFNSREYYPRVLSWAVDNNLTIIAASDVHGTLDDKTISENGAHRPVTLVLAKERSAEGVKEALFAGRTLALFHNTIAAKESIASDFVDACIKVKKLFENGKNVTLILTNSGDIRFTFKVRKSTYILPAKSSITISLPATSKRIDANFTNIFIYENRTLAHSLQIQ